MTQLLCIYLFLECLFAQPPDSRFTMERLVSVFVFYLAAINQNTYRLHPP